MSLQYINVCQKNGIDLPSSVKPGKVLGVSQKYFDNSCDFIMEIACKLTHVLWRVLCPAERSAADDNLNELAYSALLRNDYRFSSQLLEFFLNGMKSQFSSDRVKRVAVINLAQSYKWMGEKDKCENIIASYDWTSCGLDFSLAVKVLNEEYESAAHIMRAIGNSSSPSKGDYLSWPLFREFRRTHEFKDAFREVFGEDFSEDTKVSSIPDVVKRYINIKPAQSLSGVKLPDEEVRQGKSTTDKAPRRKAKDVKARSSAKATAPARKTK